MATGQSFQDTPHIQIKTGCTLAEARQRVKDGTWWTPLTPAMARGLFITGFTVAEVLAIQRRAKELLLEGKTIMNWNDADTSVSKQFAMPVEEVLEECGHALRVLDPATYGKPRIAAASFIDGYLPK